MKILPRNRDNRSQDQILEHYEVEKELAERLKNAPREDRRMLYTCLYDELYQRVPHHPQLMRKLSPVDTEVIIAFQMRFLKPFLSERDIFLEIGPGDCALSCEVAKFVRQVYAVDVSNEVTKRQKTPDIHT